MVKPKPGVLRGIAIALMIVAVLTAELRRESPRLGIGWSDYTRSLPEIAGNLRQS